MPVDIMMLELLNRYFYIQIINKHQLIPATCWIFTVKSRPFDQGITGRWSKEKLKWPEENLLKGTRKKCSTLSFLIHGGQLKCTDQSQQSADERHIDAYVRRRKEPRIRIYVNDSLETPDNDQDSQ